LVGRVVDDKTKELVTALLAYPNVETDWIPPKAARVQPVKPVIPLSHLKTWLDPI
jgi:hypothetical protein